jgi:hypothetical protein
MKRPTLMLLALLLTPSWLAAQVQVANRPAAAEKIANATAAAPPSITAQATILDWPATPGGKPVVLRQGTNGWSCFPDFPPTDGNDPMCVDDQWLRFIEAQIAGNPPALTRIGISYMLAPGGAFSSASDPTATAPTPTNHWGHDGPHLMIAVPDTRILQGLPTTRHGGPYVMFAGTPYAHIMIPITGH